MYFCSSVMTSQTKLAVLIYMNNTLPGANVLELSYSGLSVFPISLSHTAHRASFFWDVAPRVWEISTQCFETA
jgi:hypothetical protein